MIPDHPLTVPEPYRLRRLVPGDADGLMHFYNHLSAGSKRTFRPIGLEADRCTCEAICADNEVPPGGPDIAGRKYDLVLILDGEIVGWCFIWELDSPEPNLGLGIADAHQRRGLGKVLMSAIMDVARRRRLPTVHLIAVKDNEAALRLYESFGFAICGERTSPVDGLEYYRMKVELD